jgi:hypothetical protein
MFISLNLQKYFFKNYFIHTTIQFFYLNNTFIIQLFMICLQLFIFIDLMNLFESEVTFFDFELQIVYHEPFLNLHKISNILLEAHHLIFKQLLINYLFYSIILINLHLILDLLLFPPVKLILVTVAL